MTVALMVIPQGVAYAALAGMPLVTGIYAACCRRWSAVLFSASARLSVGPDRADQPAGRRLAAPLADPGSAEWVALAVWLALLSGAMQLVLGAGALRLAAEAGQLAGADRLHPGRGAADHRCRSCRRCWASRAADRAGAGRRRRPTSRHRLRPGQHGACCGWASAWRRAFRRRWCWCAAAAAQLVIGYALRGGAVVGALPAGLPALLLARRLPLDTLGALLLPALHDHAGELPGNGLQRQDRQRARRQALEREPGPDRPGPGQDRLRPVAAPSRPARRSRARPSTCTPAPRPAGPRSSAWRWSCCRAAVAHAAALPRAAGGAGGGGGDGHVGPDQAARLRARCGASRASRRSRAGAPSRSRSSPRRASTGACSPAC